MHRSAVTRNIKALFALAAISCIAAPLRAQGQAVLLGSVRADSSDIPLGHAEIAIPSLKRRAYTDSAGHFRMDNIRPGQYDVVVRRFGFVPNVMKMTFETDETTAQQFQLTPSPIVLAKIKIVAPDTARSLELDNATAFERRRSHGFGSFITPDELYAARDHDMTTVLHTIPAVQFYRLSTGAMVAGSAESGKRCFSQVYLDGVKVMYAFDVNSITPGSLRGVEFYPSPNAPSDYTASAGYCGVLVFWTRTHER